MIRVPYVDIGKQERELREGLLAAADRGLTSGQFILGDEVARFEEQFAAYCGTRFAVGVVPEPMRWWRLDHLIVAGDESGSFRTQYCCLGFLPKGFCEKRLPGCGNERT